MSQSTALSFLDQLAEAQDVLRAMQAHAETVDQITRLVSDALLRGQTVFTCGNGGSATDAMHLAQELLGRYRSNRRPLPAVCLNAEVGSITCIANDFGYDETFARQLAALARSGDVLVSFSTSGQSPNILRAMVEARTLGVVNVALLGKDGGAALAAADHALIVPSSTTARIQEVHTLLLHAICEQIEYDTTVGAAGTGA